MTAHLAATALISSSFGSFAQFPHGGQHLQGPGADSTASSMLVEPAWRARFATMLSMASTVSGVQLM